MNSRSPNPAAKTERKRTGAYRHTTSVSEVRAFCRHKP